MTAVYILISLLFVLIVVVFVYNKFIKLKNLVDEAWSLIDVQLKLRYDLIPNLVASVKAYTDHEQNILRDVAALRAKAMENTSAKGKTVPENSLSDKLAQLMITVENYPELKANEQFLKLQTQLHNIEDQLQMARRYYNGAVRNHNIAIQSFPANLIAALFKFEKYDFFELDSIDERKNVQISFS